MVVIQMTLNAVQQAKTLAALGFRLLPLLNKGQPYEAGYGADDPDFTCGPEFFARQPTLVGILCGPCPALKDDWLICIDKDGNYADVPTLTAFLDMLPETLTSHGRRHLFFRVPPSPARSKLKQWNNVFGTKDGTGAAIDLKWAGGYACELWDWDGPLTVDTVARLPDAALETLLVAGAGSERTAVVAADGGPDYLRTHGFDPDVVLSDAKSWLATRAPVAKPGSGHDTLMVVFGALLVGFGLATDDAFELARDVYNPRCEPPWEDDELEKQFDHKINQILEHGSESFAELQLAIMYRDVRALAVIEAKQAAKAAGVPAGSNLGHPTQDLSECVLNPVTGWPYILQNNTRFWLHAVGSPFYRSEITASELEVSVARRLYNQVADSCRTLKDLKAYYIRPVEYVRPSYVVRANVYSTEEDTLTLAALRWTTRKATFHPGIDAWLRALFGSAYDSAAQWLASLTALDRPAPCLYMIGPKELGKGLLSSGIASLWGQIAPCSLREAIGDFNPHLAECPLVFGDEGFPEKFCFDWFREAITAQSQRINAKNVKQYTIEGCARFMLAANNAEGLRYQRTGNLTKDDLEAITARLLVVELQPCAKAVVQTLDTDAAARYQIAEHILCLAETVALEPRNQRMAAKCGGGDTLLQGVMVGRYADILDVIRDALGAEDDSQGREPLAHAPERAPDELWISVPRLLARLKQMDGCRVSRADVKAFCASHSLRPVGEQHKLGGVNTMVRVLDLLSVLEAIEQLD